MKNLRELIALAGLVGVVMIVATRYAALPDRVPIHFNASGVVNGWGYKSSLWALVGMACFLYGVLSAARFLPEQSISLPVSAERRATAMPVAMEMLGWVKAEAMWTFAWITWSVVSVASGRSDAMSAWFMPVTMAYTFGTVGFYLWRMTRV